MSAADLQPYAAVDVIISEWMGYCLLFECMLPSVLAVRDRWCPNGRGASHLPSRTPAYLGTVYPERAQMYISAWSDEDVYDERVTYWSKVRVPLTAACVTRAGVWLHHDGNARGCPPRA